MQFRILVKKEHNKVNPFIFGDNPFGLCMESANRKNNIEIRFVEIHKKKKKIYILKQK